MELNKIYADRFIGEGLTYDDVLLVPAESDVLLCPVPKWSHGLSDSLGNPLIPPSVRSVPNSLPLPVRIFHAYA